MWSVWNCSRGSWPFRWDSIRFWNKPHGLVSEQSSRHSSLAVTHFNDWISTSYTPISIPVKISRCHKWEEYIKPSASVRFEKHTSLTQGSWTHFALLAVCCSFRGGNDRVEIYIRRWGYGAASATLIKAVF